MEALYTLMCVQSQSRCSAVFLLIFPWILGFFYFIVQSNVPTLEFKVLSKAFICIIIVH